MKFKMSLKSRMLVYILTTSLLIYAVVLGYVSIKLNNIALNNAKELTKTYTREYAQYTSAQLSSEMNMARALAQIGMGYNELPSGDMVNIFNTMLENLIRENNEFISSWMIFELKAIRPDWKKTHGRLRLTGLRSGEQITNITEIIDTTPGFTRGTYYDMLEKKIEYVMDPYNHAYTLGEEEILMTSVGVNIMENGNSVGVAGFDIELQRYQEVISGIQPIQGSYAFLIAHNGQLVAHKDKRYIGTFVQDSIVDDKELITKIQKGKEFRYLTQFDDGKDYWVSYAAVKIGKSPMFWSFGLVVPVDVVLAEERATLLKSVYAGLIGLIVVAIIIWIIAHNISSPIKKTTSILADMAVGDIDNSKKLNKKSNDEIGQMSISVNSLIDGLNRTALFAREIGEGNLETEFELLGEKDVLGSSLLEMRKSLALAKEQEEKRKEEDKKQNWATQGLAKFGEILRQNTDDMKEFSYSIISNLVKYIDAKQGGIFVINDDDKADIHLELLGCYAYERRKFMDKRVEMGVGLVGRCVREQKIIHMTDLPDDYMNITSGLGKAVPNSLLIVPLKVNEEIYGVIELAGFNSFEKHVITFVEELGETIASTISTTKINIRTSQLLEQSQQQSEEMAAQEEEMRQNMEELQATQEEAGRRGQEMKGLLDALNSANLVIEYDLDGHIITVNDNYLQLVETSSDKLIGTHQSDNMKLSKAQKKENVKFWEDLKHGIPKKETERVEFNEHEYVFIATYTPILDEENNPVRILKIATDITDLEKGAKN